LSVPDSQRTQLGLAFGELISERYRVERRLGTGGMGEAYLADDQVLHRKVTLKRLAAVTPLDPSSADRLLTEAKRATAITNPHIAQVFDVCRHNGELLLVMEFIPGLSLRALLGAPIPAERFFSLAIQLAEAIQAAHVSGVLHCDIKPENVIVAEHDFVKVLDFGLAQIMTAPTRDYETVSLASSDSTLSGTPGYMAPEVLREAPQTEQSDIFALGVVFYEMAGGKNPYKGKTFADSVHLTLSQELPPLDVRTLRLPDDLNRILRKTLMRLPEQRYATVRDLLVDLRACQQQGLLASASTAHVPKSTVRDIASPQPRARLSNFALVSILVFIGVAALTTYFLVIHKRGMASLPTPPSAAPETPHTSLVVVIPFQVVGGDKAWVAYGEGLREALTSSLARVALGHSVEVMAASEVRAHALTTAEMARKELGADLVIEGSLQAHRPSVRVDYSLVNASGRILSADHVTSTMADPFALEDQVVQGVLGMLELQLGQRDRQQLAEHGTQQGAAYESYLQGIGFLRDFDNSDNLDRALRSLEQAIQIDPKFARAYAGLGETHWAIYKSSSNESQIALAKKSCQTGLNLNPKVADVHICLGQIAGGTGQVQQAADEFERASRLDPSSDEALNGLAAAYEHMGRSDDAERVYRSAIDRRPYYWANYYALSNFLVRQAKYAQAQTILETAVNQFPSNSFLYRRLGVIEFFQGRYAPSIAALKTSLDLRPHADAYSDLGLVYLHQRLFPQAIDAFERAVRLDPQDYGIQADLADAYFWSPDHRGKAAAAYQRSADLAEAALRVNPRNTDARMVAAYAKAALGRRQDALTRLNEVLKYAPEDAEVYYYAARTYARLGERNPALTWLRKAVARGYSSADVKTAPDFESFHDDPLLR
jgi:serine/threonine protein kinase/tetratricopeptide (TPR) repeat protein